MRAPNLGISGALCLVWSLVAMGAAPVLPDSIQACKRETDNERRLQCYDREVAKFPLTNEQALGLSESQVAAAQAKGSVAPPPEEQFSARVVTLTDRLHAGFVVKLDNGQIWVQDEMETGTFAKVGDVVSIKRGKFGAYSLEGPSGRRTKVHRFR